MKIMHLISGGDVGGAKTHVLSLLKGLGQTQTVRLVCFTGGAFADEALEMGIDTLVMDCGVPEAVRHSASIPALVGGGTKALPGEATTGLITSAARCTASPTAPSIPLR